MCLPLSFLQSTSLGECLERWKTFLEFSSHSGALSFSEGHQLHQDLGLQGLATVYIGLSLCFWLLDLLGKQWCQQRPLTREGAWLELCSRKIILAAVWRNELPQEEMTARNTVTAFHMFQVRDDENLKENHDNDIGPPVATGVDAKSDMGLTDLHMVPDCVMHTSVASGSTPAFSHGILHTFFRQESTCHKHVCF